MQLLAKLMDEHVCLLHSGARRTARLRLAIALFATLIFGANLGAVPALIWLAAYAGCEVCTGKLYERLQEGPAGPFHRLAALGTTIWATGVWMAMAITYWRTGLPAHQFGGTLILCALIVHAQCFAVRSRLGLAVIGGAPALSLVALPLVAADFPVMGLVTALSCALLSLAIMGASAKVSAGNARALEEARAASEAATQAKSEFLASVSHEIRTPMNGIVGVLHLMKAEPLSPSALRLLDDALSCSAMLAQLIDDVLDLSKVEAGKLDLSYEACDPEQILGSLIELLEPQARAKGLFLLVDVPIGVGWRSTDPVRFRQCLFNLVGNAVKFTQAGGVRVRLLSPHPGLLRVEVIDTGPGLAPEAQARLFQRFEQAASTVRREHGGAGLGLAITRTLAELMGGTTGLESTLGVGSTFWFEIEAPACVPTEHAPVEGGSLAGLRVLIVDDNGTNRLVGSKILEGLGATAVVADGGELAVRQCEIEDFDLILMDINMPGIDGRQAAQIIRRSSIRNARTPIIALTADVMAHQKTSYLAAGMDGVVAKPFSPIQLVDEILRVASQGAVAEDAPGKPTATRAA